MIYDMVFDVIVDMIHDTWTGILYDRVCDGTMVTVVCMTMMMI